MEKKTKRSLYAAVLLILLGIQLCFLVYTNLFCIFKTLDNDTAKLFIHAVEMWKNKTAFIPSWTNQTTLEIDCPLFIAVFIYGLTGNIYISFGIADIILTAFLFYVAVRILKRIGASSEERLTTLVVLLIPYSFGQLLYYNMTFFSGGQYLVKTLVPLMLIDLLSDEEDKKRSFVILGFILCFLSFLCGVSSSGYVFLTGIFPVMLCAFWYLFLSRDSLREGIFNRRTYLCMAVTACTMAGMVISHIMHVGSSTTGTGVINVGEAVSGFFMSLKSIMELLGSFPYDFISFMSLTAAGYVFRGFWAIFVMAVMIRAIKEVIGSFLKADRDSFIKASFVAVIIVNFIILWFTGRNGEARYYTSTVFTGLILAGTCGLFKEPDTENTSKAECRQKRILRTAFLLLFTVMIFLSDIKVLKSECFPAKLGDNIKLMSLADVLSGYPEKTVFFLNDTDSAELLRIMDYESGRVYLAYKTEGDIYNNSGVVVNDYYTDLTDAGRLDDDHLMVVNEYITDISSLPGYMKSLYTEIDRFQNFVVYRASVNRMDGLIGYENNKVSKDYCYTDGYKIYAGELDENGYLAVKGNDDYVIASPYLGYHTGPLTVSMKYALSGEDKPGDPIGTLEIWDGDRNELIGSADIGACSGEGEVTLEGIVLNRQNPVMKVYIKDGRQVSIENFTYKTE